MTATTYQEQIQALAGYVHDMEGRLAALEKQLSAGAAAPAPRKPKPEDEPLFESLRAWRRERAASDNCEPFQIFGDAALTAIAAAKPNDRYEFLQIKGIGPHKTTLYAGEVIELVRQFAGDEEW